MIALKAEEVPNAFRIGLSDGCGVGEDGSSNGDNNEEGLHSCGRSKRKLLWEKKERRYIDSG